MTTDGIRNQALLDAVCNQRNALANENAALQAEVTLLKSNVAELVRRMAGSDPVARADTTEEQARVEADEARRGKAN